MVPWLFFLRIAIYNNLQDLIDDSDDYYYNNDDDWEDWKNAILWFALPPLLGAITLGLAAVFSFTSLCFWKDAGSPAAAMAVTTAHVSVDVLLVVFLLFFLKVLQHLKQDYRSRYITTQFFLVNLTACVAQPFPANVMHVNVRAGTPVWR